MAVVQSANFTHREFNYQIDEVEGDFSVLGANGLTRFHDSTKAPEWAQLNLTVKSPNGHFFHAWLPGIGEVFGTDALNVSLDVGYIIDKKFGVKYDQCFH